MTSATVRQDGDTLAFSGALERAAVAPLWAQLRTLGPGLRRIDLSAVSRVDSAGLAMLSALCARSPAARVDGNPPGLAELRAAYRLDDALTLAS